MNIEIGARVRAADGAEVGRVHRVVVDLEQEAVASVVVLQGGLLPRDVLVPLDYVERAESDSLTLSVSRHELDELPDFAENDFFTAPPTWAFPFVYPGGFVYIPVRQRKRESATQFDLKPGTLVFATDGKLGQVDSVESDQFGHLDAIRVQANERSPELRVPVEWIESVDERGVRLLATRQQVAAGLAEHRPTGGP